MATGIRGMRIDSEDLPGTEQFLNTAASAAEIQQFLIAAKSGAAALHQHFYDPRSRTATFVTTWRGRVVCLMALDVTAAQCESIEGQMAQRDVAAWTSLPSFQDSVEAALGISVNAGLPSGKYLAHWWQPRRRG